MKRPRQNSDRLLLGGLGGRPIATFLFGVCALWFVVEWLLFGLIAQHLGWFLTIALSIVKGGLGLVLLGYVLRKMQLNFRRMLDGGGIRLRLAEPLLAVLGAVMICLPGFVGTLIGLSLFAPSVRLRIIGRVMGGGATFGKSRQPPGTIELAADDYREIGRGQTPR